VAAFAPAPAPAPTGRWPGTPLSCGPQLRCRGTTGVRQVNETAPRMFAVIEWTDDDGVRDAEALGWGLEFEDGRVSTQADFARP
jgi:hypothetical protein